MLQSQRVRLVLTCLVTLAGVSLVAGDLRAAQPSPYPLDTCAVAGTKLGSMGDPYVFQHEGREVRLCCEGCLEKFQAEPPMYLKKVDQKIIAQQSARYPLNTCLMSGESLEGEKPAEVVVDNRMARFCCKMCAGKFKKNPEKLLVKLDEAIMASQTKTYPLDTCVVSGEKLGSMGDAIPVIVNNQLVQLCCKGCKKKLQSEPTKFVKKVNDAWALSKSKKKQMKGAEKGVEKKPVLKPAGG